VASVFLPQYLNEAFMASNIEVAIGLKWQRPLLNDKSKNKITANSVEFHQSSPGSGVILT